MSIDVIANITFVAGTTIAGIMGLLIGYATVKLFRKDLLEEY